MSKFLSEKLGVAAEIIPGFAFKSEEFGKTGTKAVKIKDINPPIINAAEADRVNVSNYSRERLKKYEIHEGDFVVAMTGATVGKIGKHVSKEVLYINQRVAKIVPRSGFYKEFVYYAIQGGDFLKFILNRLDSSSAQGNISGTSIGEYPIPCPDFQTQRGVAAVLSALDSKIELNNRINAELEGMAKLLYDYWFVQFDFPMTAAQAAALGKPHLTGHPYRASGGKMIYNETLKREIPEGWEATTLSQFANITMGQSPPGDSYNQKASGMVFFQGSTDFGWRYPQVREFTTAPSRLAKAGDILLSVRAPVGTLNIADQACCIGRGLAALNAKSGHDSFLFEVMLYFKTIFDRRNTSGTTFGSITKDDLHSLEFACPSKDSPLLDAFEEKMKPAHKTILNNHQQNQELTQLRDWLLPMLMNGQVTVG